MLLRVLPRSCSPNKGPHVTNSERIALLSWNCVRETRLSKTEFIISVRHFLCLPSLKIYSDEPDRLPCGCEIESCANPHCSERKAMLDPAGNDYMPYIATVWPHRRPSSWKQSWRGRFVEQGADPIVSLPLAICWGRSLTLPNSRPSFPGVSPKPRRSYEKELPWST